MRQRFQATARALLEEDPRVAVVLADIWASHIRGDRVFNLGIREQLMIGVTAGLAMTGMRPIAHSYATFLVDWAYEQIKLDLTHQDVPAVLVSIAGSYDAAPEGRTHQSPGDVALFDTIGGWTVHVPGHPDEVDTLLRRAVADGGRTYIRLAARTNAMSSPMGGRWRVVRRGTRGTVVAVGPLLDVAVEAVADLDLTVLHAASLPGAGRGRHRLAAVRDWGRARAGPRARCGGPAGEHSGLPDRRAPRTSPAGFAGRYFPGQRGS
jgi:transketolase